MQGSSPPNITRPDGRPEAYDIPNGTEVQCEICMIEGHQSPHGRGKIVMVSPADMQDGKPHFLCVEKHVHKDTVIVDPNTGNCRDVTGQNVWNEEPGGPRNYLEAGGKKIIV